jgi:asparagine synthase (glutamine-hydrolysing)
LYIVPGVLGVVGRQGTRAVSEEFGRVLAAMDGGGRLAREIFTDPHERWAIGRLRLGASAPPGSEHGVHVLFHGDLDNAAMLADSLREGGANTSSEEPASIVRELYRRHGRDAAARLKGAFVAVVLDTSSGDLLLISDRLGSYPLYWFALPDRLVFASELRAGLKAHPRPTLNARAVADFLKFGFPMGDRTLAAGVDLLPQCSTLLYRSATGEVSIEAYGSVAELFQPDATDRGQYTRSVLEAFDTAMSRVTRGSPRLGLSLSGGLDTRVILSALDAMGRSKGMPTFTLGGRGCADEVIGETLARMAQTNHRFVALDDHYLDDLLPTVERMVALTDGMYLSHGFTEMLALSGFEETDATLLLRGHAGELAKASTAWPFHTDATVFGMRTADEFAPYLLSRLTHVSRGDAAREVLTESFADALDGGAAASLYECLDGVALSPPDLCSYVYLKEYHRRVTIPSIEIFRTRLDVRLPLADEDFLRAVLRGPAAWRDGVTLHQAIIRAHGPAYLRVRNPNTGAPAGAGPAVEFVLDKVNTILRRLNVYGYRHYHSFDGWMRQALLRLVDQILLDPRTLARGVFRESAVRERVAQARQGGTDHDDLLQALVIVELWQRQFL